MAMIGCFVGYHKKSLIPAIILPLLAVFVISTPAWAAPVITLSPASGAVGTTVVINGTNFDSYKGDNISIYFDDTQIPDSPLTVPGTGSFTAVFTIPETEIGRHWFNVYAEGNTTNALAKNFFIVEETEMALDVADGPVGTMTTLSGWGFYADRTVTIYYYNIISEKLGTAVASSIGELTYRFAVPDSTAGEHKITAVNNDGDAAEASFYVIPSTTLNLTSASPGDLLTVSGTGFGYRIEVTISFGTRPVASARTDEFGNFEVKFNIPEVYPGTYDVKSLDEHGNLHKAQFITTAGASISQTTGSVGSKLTVQGAGFTAGETVTVDYDNLQVATAVADNNGAFFTSFNIPASTGGEHVITVSDGIITKRFTFTLESEPPPAPALLLPDNNTETKARVYLDWQAVTDTSLPVVYTLQIASDQNFTTIALEKTGLPESEYALPVEETLPAAREKVPYYWRIKAVDGAGNQSEWASTRLFYVSAPPVPELLQPESDTEADMPLFFNWQDVSSLSPPVTYSFQIASDLNFTSILLDAKGVADSEFFLAEEENLPELQRDIPYYWRVKAIDDAGNESGWSAPWAFYFGSSFTFPGWLIYTLIGIAVIAVGYIAFRVGKRTAIKPPD
jgi:hypothetical protein